MNKETKYFKEFKLSTLALSNRKTVYLIIFLIFISGLMAYNSMPKESFPELNIPEIYISTPYPGGSPKFIDDKITSQFEEELTKIKEVDKITSSSVFGFNSMKIEFEYGIEIDVARQKVKDAIDDARAKSDFPELDYEPRVMEVNTSDMPIMNVNLSGDLSKKELDKYANMLEDKIEAISSVSEVEIRGLQEKKLEIKIDQLQAQARNISLNDITNTIRNENIVMPGGEILIGNKNRSIKIDAEYRNIDEVKNTIVKSEGGEDEVYLKDIAEVTFGEADIISFARQNGDEVLMLDIKKRSGENILSTADQIKEIVDKREGLPKNVKITITNDQSKQINDMLNNLVNSILFGIILVVLVLMFYMGIRNALFVGVAIPLSMLMSFMILKYFGISLNIMVLFSLVIALGMLVDNGIVVVENIYRLMKEGNEPLQASKIGISEIAWPIISSTATTLAAFLPLALWPGIMGEFMKYLPITLIVVLSSSLFVALIINPVLIAIWMKVEEVEIPNKQFWKRIIIFISIGIIFLFISRTLGNLILLLALFVVIYRLLLKEIMYKFQNKIVPSINYFYGNRVVKVLKRPFSIIIIVICLFFFSIILLFVFPPKTLFFPDNQPLYANIYIETPIGTDINYTNKITKQVEDILNKKVINKYKNSFVIDDNKDTTWLISNVMAQVGEGTSDPNSGVGSFGGGSSPNKSRISINFADYEDRNGINTSDVIVEINKALKGKFNSDIIIIVDKNQDGPPQEAPINIEIQGGEDYDQTIEFASNLKKFFNNKNIDGVDKLKLNIDVRNPELILEIDRNKAIKYGLSTAQVASAIRTSVFGDDISTYKYDNESYDINLRLKETDRKNIDEVLNQNINFRNNKGTLLSIPIYSLIKDKQDKSSFGSVTRKDEKKLVTLFSKVTADANATEVVEEMKSLMPEFLDSEEGKQMLEKGFLYNFSGQMEQQGKEMAFLSNAMLIAVFLIMLIIVTQFNSFSAPIIIITTIFFSIIGVLLGLIIFRNDFVIMMTMIGIISLAGIVVNNGIILVDYTNLIIERKRIEYSITNEQLLDLEHYREAIIEAGKTRLTPVILTSTTTVLGMLPMAIGLNIDFISFFSTLDPNISWGGDNAIFFGPISQAIIYGLVFSVLLTLMFVPAFMLVIYKLKLRFNKNKIYIIQDNK